MGRSFETPLSWTVKKVINKVYCTCITKSLRVYKNACQGHMQNIFQIEVHNWYNTTILFIGRFDLGEQILNLNFSIISVKKTQKNIYFHNN